MPVEKDNLVKKWWWCPKWYWPFAVCSGYRTVHQWCYSFSWVERTGYALFIQNYGCEGGKLYSWKDWGAAIGNLDTFVPAQPMCFDSPRNSAGICDGSNTGLAASPLSRGRPFVSNFVVSLRDLHTQTAESGTFEFTEDSGGLCQQGIWPWQRVLHEQILTVSLDIRHVTVEWYVGGTLIQNTSGVLSLSEFCRWPFPLPAGRTENRIVNLKYEVTTNDNNSTINLYNNSSDGAFSISVGVRALVGGTEYASYYTSWMFEGETCEFNPTQVADKEKCLKRYSDVSSKNAKTKIPKFGEPVITVSDDIIRYATEDKKTAIASLINIIQHSYNIDQPLTSRAINQLERELGLAGTARLITVGSGVDEEKILFER
jgi:hypothetical protein